MTEFISNSSTTQDIIAPSWCILALQDEEGGDTRVHLCGRN